MDIVEKEFKNRAAIRGGIYMFSSSVAIEVINKCNELNKKIFGIDAFIITEETTQPVQEHSIDFSLKGSSEGNWEEAKKFILERIDEDLLFEIVFEE